MLDLSKPILKTSKKVVNGEDVFFRHLTQPQLLEFAERGGADNVDEVQLMYDLLNATLCDKDGKSITYTNEQYKSQPFSLIRELAEFAMSECGGVTEKKS